MANLLGPGFRPANSTSDCHARIHKHAVGSKHLTGELQLLTLTQHDTVLKANWAHPDDLGMV